MIDFDKEEFLARLDIRISVIVSALGSHEKYLCKDLSHKDFKEAIRQIDKANKEILDYLSKTDQKIQENFWNMKQDFEKWKERQNEQDFETT